jgi:hypothetical protein
MRDKKKKKKKKKKTIYAKPEVCTLYALSKNGEGTKTS